MKKTEQSLRLGLAKKHTTKNRSTRTGVNTDITKEKATFKLKVTQSLPLTKEDEKDFA